jgi:carbon-monoxide dehydrogenase large subunit
VAGTLTTGSFVDYTIPSAADLPSWTTDRTQSPATSNPLGVKGVGEAGTIASTPAIVNAIVDALQPWGVDDVEMPCTPQRVWRAMQSAASAATSQALPTGTPDVELAGGGRIDAGHQIGVGTVAPELAESERPDGDNDGGDR